MLPTLDRDLQETPRVGPPESLDNINFLILPIFQGLFGIKKLMVWVLSDVLIGNRVLHTRAR